MQEVAPGAELEVFGQCCFRNVQVGQGHKVAVITASSCQAGIHALIIDTVNAKRGLEEVQPLLHACE